jgi:pyruvate/2-oxoglutarate/acetoin dehydrogenase E1 component
VEGTPKSKAWSRNRLIRDGIYRAIHEQMSADPSIYLFGEGSHMKVHFDAPYIEKDFPDRIITLPISEDGNTNFAVGTSLVGVKPIVDVISSDFLFRTMDSIANTAAKLNHVSAEVDKPKTVVVRSEFFLGGPTTGQRTESLFTHIPGLNVVLPSNPRDARGLMRTALLSEGVTVFFEDRMIEDSSTKEEDKDDGTTEHIPLGSAKLRRRGDALTIVSYALTLRDVESVVEAMDLDCDVIDPRTLYPMDFDTICDSVSRTGALLIVEPDVKYAGIGSEIAATVAERTFSSLRKPVRRVGAGRAVIPASIGLHKFAVPSKDEIRDAIKELAAH